MSKAQFDHVLRAAAEVTGETDFIVVGSQSIVGYLKHIPPGLARSNELDIYPLKATQKAHLIEAIGVDSEFHRSFRATCPEGNDLVAAKLIAYRDKDRDYAREAFNAGVASPDLVVKRLRSARGDAQAIDRAKSWIRSFRKIRKDITALYRHAGKVLAGAGADELKRRLDTVFERYARVGSVFHEDFRGALLDAERKRIVEAAAKASVSIPDLSAPP